MIGGVIPKGIVNFPLPEFDYKKQTEFMRKLGREPFAAIIINGKVTHVDYISVKVLERLKALKVNND